MTIYSEAKRRARLRTYETISTLKEYRGISDLEIERQTGISHTTINSWTNGRSEVSLAAIDILANAFDVPSGILLLPVDEAMAWVKQHSPNPPVSIQRAHPSRKARNTRRSTSASTMWETPVRGELVGAAAA